jgi:hypothetical protein
MEEIMKKIQEKPMTTGFGFYDAFQAKPMDTSEKLSYLRELDKKCPDFGFYDAFQWYQRKKSANIQRNMDSNRKEKLLCEIFKIENPDAIEGYVNSPFRQ